MKLTAVAATLAALVLLLIAWDASASARGRLKAHYDVARGHYRLQGYGLPSPWRTEYARLLRERYGIEYWRVADCIVSRSLVAYVDAYNEVSAAAARKKFGTDIFADAAEDAQRTWIHRDAKTYSGFKPLEHLFPYASDKKRDIQCFRAFAEGASMEEIVEHCGRPDEETGTEKYVFVYHLPDRSTVSIATPSLREVSQAVQTDQSGKQNLLFLQARMGDEIRLRATVQSIVPVSDFSGTIIPIDVDPKFALTLRIGSADSSAANFKPDSLITLGVHSPSRLFEGEPAQGKTYNFVLHHEVQNGRTRFFGLKAAI